jgi:hypothetical protein
MPSSIYNTYMLISHHMNKIFASLPARLASKRILGK